jgi:hypothetical protein
MDAPTPGENSGGSLPGQTKSTAVGCFVIITICLPVVASLVTWYYQTPPLAVARQYVSEQLGIAPDQLELVRLDSQDPNVIFGYTTVEFRAKGVEHSKKRVVKLSRPIYFLPWRVYAFQEGKE